MRLVSMLSKNTAIGIMLIFAWVPTAFDGLLPRAASARDKCLDSIASVKSDIEERLGGVVTATKSMSVDDWKGDADFMREIESPFSDANLIVVFGLASHMGRGGISLKQGQAAENIMASPLLTRSYAKEIIESCEPVASVKFFYWEWYQGWSLHKGGVLKEDKCKEPGGSQLTWGENPCL